MSDLAIKRTPTELEKFVDSYRDTVSKTDLANGLLRSTDDYKFFIDELLPLSRLCSSIFDDSFEIEPIRGNQGYDASVYRNGIFQFNIEIAKPHDGASRAKDARDTIRYGVGKFRMSDDSSLYDLEKEIRHTCKMKSIKDYSDAKILFFVDTGAAYKRQAPEFEGAMSKIVSVIAEYEFISQGIYIYFSPFGVVKELQT